MTRTPVLTEVKGLGGETKQGNTEPWITSETEVERSEPSK